MSKRRQSVLCDSRFCRLLSKFKSFDRLSAAEDLTRFFRRERLFEKDEHDVRDHGVYLGTRSDIASRTTCPFCRLSNSAILESPARLAWWDDEEIFVLWDPERQTFNLRSPKLIDSKIPRSLPLGERIRLCNRSQSRSSRTGREVDPSGIHPSLMKEWIELCDRNHQNTCPSSNPRLRDLQLSSDQLRLIDVHDKCIVQRPWNEDYVALSYVWGQTPQLGLNKNNLGLLTTPFALESNRNLVSKTIWDAMHFIETVGRRYLWADSLCLVQDDPVELNRGIQHMGLIFEGAQLTIVAANGSSADAGLIRRDRNKGLSSQRSEEVMPGLRFAIVRAVDCYLRASVWASRGWTYQEEIFSRRSIIFVNNQVYFRCRQRIWAEDTWADLRPAEQDLDEWNARLDAVVQDIASDVLHPLDQLFHLIEGFQGRSLTRDTDAINAVSGILQPLSQRMRTSLLEGLPTCAFDLALLFAHHHPIGQHSPGRRRREFPSWSWAGWAGSTHWNAVHELYNSHDVTGINDWLDNRVWIVWYKAQRGQFVKIVRYAEPVGLSERVTRDIMYERRSPLPPSDRFPKLRTSRTEPSNFFVKNVSHALLAFYTVSIVLTVSSYIPGAFLDAQDLHLDALFDNENSFCGFISPDLRHSAIENWRLELIILSECQASSFPPLDRRGMEDRIHPIWSDRYEDKGSQTADFKDWELYWVLAIARTGDYYERRGLGQILRSSVDKSFKPGPQWKEIVLG